MNHFIVDGRYKDILQYHGINISEVLPTGVCGIDEVAEELGLSRRTLQIKFF